jgi:3-oxoacyl-ACP reductase-like protein
LGLYGLVCGFGFPFRNVSDLMPKNHGKKLEKLVTPVFSKKKSAVIKHDFSQNFSINRIVHF